MSNETGMTTEQIRKQNISELGKGVAERQQARAERYQKLGSGMNRTISDSDIAKMTTTAQGLLDGSITPEDAVKFSKDCSSAINTLDKKILNMRMTAGLASHQGRMESYKKIQSDIAEAESKIKLFKTFT